jgi:hypothetical protein
LAKEFNSHLIGRRLIIYNEFTQDRKNKAEWSRFKQLAEQFNSFEGKGESVVQGEQYANHMFIFNPDDSAIPDLDRRIHWIRCGGIDVVKSFNQDQKNKHEQAVYDQWENFTDYLLNHHVIESDLSQPYHDDDLIEEVKKEWQKQLDQWAINNPGVEVDYTTVIKPTLSVKVGAEKVKHYLRHSKLMQCIRNGKKNQYMIKSIVAPENSAHEQCDDDEDFTSKDF